MSTFRNVEQGESPRLRAALERLDALVDWERRSRHPERGPRMRQSVEPARDLFDRLGAPDAQLRCLLIAGTKGKGSVAALVGAGLARAGESVGVYASPHVARVHERIRIAGRAVQDGELAAALEEALGARDAAVAAGSAAAEGTWFDLLTAAALVAFRRAGVRWAVLECGLGGRLDSTNAVSPELCVLTNVGLEHTAILGRTRAAIAREKAGIARPGRPLLSAVGEPGDEAADAVGEVALALGARLLRVPGRGADSIEERNARLASAVLEQLGFGPLQAATRAQARLPGRLERLTWRGTPLVLDGAHVPESLELALRDLTAAGPTEGPLTVVFGTGEAKDAAGMLKVLLGRADRVLCTSAGDGPHARPESLARLASALGLDAEAVPDPQAALDMAQRRAGATGWVLVTGSLHLIGRLRGRVAPPQRTPRC